MSEQAVSIGELEAIRAKMTPGEYASKGVTISGIDGHVVAFATGATDDNDASDFRTGRSNAAGLVAEHNAFPVLAAATKAALRYIELVDTTGEMNEEHLAKMFAAKDELRAALRKVRL